MHFIHSILNVFESMVVNGDLLETENVYTILDRMREFLTQEEVQCFPAGQRVLELIKSSV
jgi:hypothetical protein